MVDSKKYNGSTWEHSLRKLTTATEVVESPLYSDGTAITSYTVSGNTVQNGTPTPDNPVDVNGVGERTENYFDINDNRVSYQQCTISINNGVLTQTNTGGYARSEWLINNLSVGESYTFSIHFDNPNGCSVQIRLYDSNNSARLFDTSVFTDSRTVEFTFTAQTTTHYIRIYSNTLSEASQYSVDFSDIMLNLGSTALPYEPYGYKIPILSGGVTTNIYLGSTQTVRRIKKFVLTGQETGWSKSSTYRGSFYAYIVTNCLSENYTAYCSHLTFATLSQYAKGNFCFNGAGTTAKNCNLWFNQFDSSTTVDEFTAYLAQQYANGTPVTIWYILATPETAAVNEPLMKIGDYADTLSNATSIPTTEGANSITVDTTVQPSEFTATWTGWHNANVKEWDSSDWQ